MEEKINEDMNEEDSRDVLRRTRQALRVQEGWSIVLHASLARRQADWGYDMVSTLDSLLECECDWDFLEDILRREMDRFPLK